MLTDNFTFVNPEFFWGFLLLPLCIAWYLWKRKQEQATLRLSNTKGFQGVSQGIAKSKPLLFVLRMIALVLLIIAMARPRTVAVSTKSKTTRGIDIVMAIDISGSMLAKDLKPNRLEALKKVATTFIKDRVNDRIGLVLYAGESYTKTPVTSDKAIVLSGLNDVVYDDAIQGGTAIGMGLATAVNRLKDSKAKSKVIILLTDGSNNSGTIDPKIASELAVEFGIKTYTIGLGTNGMALAPVAILPNGTFQYDRVKVEIDEKLLQQIAKATGGKYFRATDNEKLEAIYKEIDTLEKSDIEEFKYYSYEEKYRFLVLMAFVVLALEMLLKHTVFKSFI